MKLKARIHLFSTEAGGRQNGIMSGYRPSFFIYEKNSDCQILFDKPIITPGSSEMVEIEVLHPELLSADIYQGRYFTIREGNKQIGWGTVTKLN
jgi:translation elongation factor EF-Tu-like GTPase